jgi:hypothetical protein
MCRCGGWAGKGREGCCSLCGGCCGDHVCSAEENGEVAERGYPGSLRWEDGRPAVWHGTDRLVEYMENNNNVGTKGTSSAPKGS